MKFHQNPPSRGGGHPARGSRKGGLSHVFQCFSLIFGKLRTQKGVPKTVPKRSQNGPKRYVKYVCMYGPFSIDFQQIFNLFSIDFQQIFNRFSMDFQFIFNLFSNDFQYIFKDFQQIFNRFSIDFQQYAGRSPEASDSECRSSEAVSSTRTGL